MTKLSEETIKDFHKKFAINEFNRTWDLIDKKNRTKQEDVEMIHTAHASRYHWDKVGEPLQFQRGEWQISRVYSILNLNESALYHGKHCLDLCIENNIEDFDLAFAYESIARPYKQLGNIKEFEKYKKLAYDAGKLIENKEDKKYFNSELEQL